MPIHKSDLLNMIEIDEDARKVFLAMNRDEQMSAILGILSYIRSEQAATQKRVIDLAQSLKVNADKQHEYRMLREAEEENIRRAINALISGNATELKRVQPEDVLTTTQKVLSVLNNKYGYWVKFFSDIFKNITQTVLTIIVLALLYLAFGGKLPTP